MAGGALVLNRKGPRLAWSRASRRTLAANEGSREELAMRLARHAEPMKRPAPWRFWILLWQPMQWLEGEMEAVGHVERRGPKSRLKPTPHCGEQSIDRSANRHSVFPRRPRAALAVENIEGERQRRILPLQRSSDDRCGRRSQDFILEGAMRTFLPCR